MKTPREILLARHRAVEPKLDAVRQRALAHLSPEKNSRAASAPGFVQAIRDFFRLPRWAWGGLVAAWLVIITLNVASSDTPGTAVAVRQEAKRSPETLQALREQKRLFAELVGALSETPAADAPRFIPRPRGERQQDTACA